MRPRIFWTPCAAHCLDLMLEDIEKIPKVKRVIQRGIKLVGYIYNHTLALNTMRKFTQKTELETWSYKICYHFLNFAKIA